MTVTRPILRYHGGKWLMAPWIIDNMPHHKVYCEPFGGAGSVMLRKPRAQAEIYNDLDGVVVAIFRILQDPGTAEQLRRRLALTPFARDEFNNTYEAPSDDMDLACKIISRSFMGHGTDSTTRTCRTGFRSKMSDSRALPAMAWCGWPESVPQFVDRLRGVVIENRDAIEVIKRIDRKQTLFYVDPPYVISTRSSLSNGRGATHGYRHELTDADHITLSETLHKVKGMVMLSGYTSPLYEQLYGGWNVVTREVLADGAAKRTECLWFNDAAWARRPQVQMFNRKEQVPA